MNIKQAKEQIQNAITAYLAKDEFGAYVIPPERQRPVILMGPPGVGKTAIMEQIAQEENLNLVSYSMTHHTRQSALGLPVLEKRVYDGREVTITEYSMSEILASVYEIMEKTGIREGILFLDEINCVSETLAPAMLQLLQYKVFGRHHIPEGWILVAAGNPPEYNRSVRDFDLVTWDRLKRIDVEPDYGAWKEYAYRKQTHPAILTYLEIKRDAFYEVRSTVDGKQFVTARGWSDLSDMIEVCEQKELPVDELLIGQYLQSPKIAKDFAVYYDLFRKYCEDYHVDQILDGKTPRAIMNRARNARFDERLSLLGLILEKLNGEFRTITRMEKTQLRLLEVMQFIRAGLTDDRKAEDVLNDQAEEIRREQRAASESGRLSEDDRYAASRTIALLDTWQTELAAAAPGADGKGAEDWKQRYDRFARSVRQQAAEAGSHLTNAFRFCEAAFGDGKTDSQEMAIFVTELTIGYHSAHYLSRYGNEAYFAHNRDLMFSERRREILRDLEALGKLDASPEGA